MAAVHQNTDLIQAVENRYKPGVKQVARDASDTTISQTYFRDTVETSIRFTWDADQPQAPKSSFFTTLLATPLTLLRPVLAIQFTPQKIAQLMQDYDAMILQSKSPNVLLAAYATAKLNGLTACMVAAGVDYAVLEKRRRAVLIQAIQDNKRQFDENEYNIEMMQLLTAKKNKHKSIKSLKKIRKELVIHMKKLGHSDWYTPLRCVQIQYDQVSKIITAFSEEADYLHNQAMQWYDEAENTGITVRISEAEITPATLLDKKQSKLKSYRTILTYRQHELACRYKVLANQGRISDRQAHDYQAILGLKSLGCIR